MSQSFSGGEPQHFRIGFVRHLQVHPDLLKLPGSCLKVYLGLILLIDQGRSRIGIIDICAAARVSGNTARHAFRILENDGWVSRTQSEIGYYEWVLHTPESRPDNERQSRSDAKSAQIAPKNRGGSKFEGGGPSNFEGGAEIRGNSQGVTKSVPPPRHTNAPPRESTKGTVVVVTSSGATTTTTDPKNLKEWTVPTYEEIWAEALRQGHRIDAAQFTAVQQRNGWFGCRKNGLAAIVARFISHDPRPIPPQILKGGTKEPTSRQKPTGSRQATEVALESLAGDNNDEIKAAFYEAWCAGHWVPEFYLDEFRARKAADEGCKTRTD